MAKIIKNQDQLQSQEPLSKAGESITSIWVLLMLSFFPLFFTDYYFNILQTKYGCFLAISALYACAIIIAAVVHATKIDWRMSLTDVLAIAFMGICIISTLCAGPYIKEAVFGNEGRYAGLILMITYVVTFFLCSRFYKEKRWIIITFMWVTLFMNLFAISDYFDMNILHFKDYIAEENYNMFTSTIGNINTYTTIATMSATAAGCLMIFGTDSKLRRIFYGVCAFIALYASVTAQSDNTYLTFIAVFGLLPLVAWKDMKGLRRYMVFLTMLLASMKLAQMTDIWYAGRVLGVNGLLNFATDLSIFNIALIACFIFTVVLFVLEAKKSNGNAPIPKFVRRAWGILLIVIVIAVIIVIAWANKNVELVNEKYGSLARYLVFDDMWGTKRGYIWRAALDEYKSLPFINKLFGTGPDTFGIYMINDKYNEMVTITGQYYDSAHNELIHYLFTIGPLGLLAYLGLLGTIVYGCFKFAEKKHYMLYVYAFIIIGYFAQSTVNIALPISTPLLWTFMGMAAAGLREEFIIKKKAEKQGSKE